MPAQMAIPAKITPPQLRAIYARTRLFGLLNDVRDVPCIWICGPPGAGKTTLAASYCEHTENPTLWYQIDEGDADIASFFFYLNLAAKKITRRRKDLPVFTAEFAGGLTAFSKRFFRELGSWFETPFILVLDDYHLLGREAALHEVLATALHSLPSGSQILAISRQEPPSALARLRANQSIHIVDWPMLRLNSSDVREIARLHKGEELSVSELEALQRQCDGWLAGLILLLEGDVQVSADDYLKNEKTPSVVFDYFAQEVFKQQPEQARTTLMQAALMPRMNVRLVKELTNHGGTGRVLSDLHRRNFFVHRLGLSRPVYQFHPLFREFLLTQLSKDLGAEEVRTLQSRAAEILESDGQDEAAIDLYLSSRKYAAAERLIRDSAQDFFEQRRLERLGNWIERLPDSITSESPWMIYWLGCLDAFTNPTVARDKFKRAFRQFREMGDQNGACLSWSGIADSLFVEQYAYQSGCEWVEAGEQLFAEIGEFQSAEVEMRVVTSMCYLLTNSRPDHPMLPSLFNRAQKLLESRTDSKSRLMLSGVLLHCIVWRVSGLEAGPLIRELEKGINTSNNDIAWQNFTDAFKAVLHFMAGRHEEALQVVSNGLVFAEANGCHTFKFNLVCHGAWAALAKGDRRLAQKFTQEFYDMGLKGSGRTIYYWLVAWQYWSDGQHEHALKNMKISFAEIENSDYIYGRAMIQCVLAIVQIDSGDFIEGRRNLKEALCASNIGPSNWLRFNCCFIDADDKLSQGKHQACLDALRIGFRTGRESDLYSTFMWSPARMSRLCTMALEHDIEVDYVQEMIRRNQLIPDLPGTALANWPWAIKIFVLGPFRLEIDGQLVGSGRNGQKKVIELLKMLVVFGSERVSATRLADALWPEAHGDDAKNALKTDLYRLRKLLVHADAIEVSSGYISLNSRYCWSDLGAFEQISHDVRDDARKSVSLEGALDLCRGPLLVSDERESWIVAASERVRSEFLRGVVMLGHYRESEKEWLKAIEVYERALEVDCFIESIYLRMMHCHQELGHNAEAIATYERCSRIFRAELGVEPSHELQLLGRELTSSSRA
jgi:LuxR family maltose regulon positive regulatory protein